MDQGLISPVITQWWDNAHCNKRSRAYEIHIGKVVFMADMIDNIVGGRYYILELIGSRRKCYCLQGKGYSQWMEFMLIKKVY